MPAEDTRLTSQAEALEAGFRHALDHLNGLDRRSVAATRTPSEIRSRLSGHLPAPQLGEDPKRVVDGLVDACEGGHLGSPSGRFFAWVIGGTLTSSLAADWLASTWDNNAVNQACGPAACAVEEVAGGWIKSLLGLPTEASFALTTGCQMAHATALAAARNALYAGIGHDVEVEGLCDAPPLTLLTNDQRHGSIDRAARLLGLGSKALVAIPTKGTGRIRPEALTQALIAHGGPKILVLNAGDLNLGAFDDFATLIPLAKAHGAWVHVDGAFGLWARLSPRFAPLVAGVELADSWATDAHKWLNTPIDCGLAFVKDDAAHRRAMAFRVSYITAAAEGRDPMDFTPEWTRRGRGFALYAAVRELGQQGIAAMIERCCDLTEDLVDGLAQLPQCEVVAYPVLNQALVRFTDPKGSNPDADDRRTDAMISAINATGEAFFSGSTFGGRRVMRISLVNWRTSAEDIRRTLACISDVACNLT